MKLVKYISNVYDFCRILRRVSEESCGCRECFNFRFNIDDRLSDIIYAQPNIAELDCGYSLLYSMGYRDNTLYKKDTIPILLIGNTLVDYDYLIPEERDRLVCLGINNTLIDNPELLYQIAEGLNYTGIDFLGKLGISEEYKNTVNELEAGFGETSRYYAISSRGRRVTVEDCPWLRIVVTDQNNNIQNDIIDPPIIAEVYRKYKSDPYKGIAEFITEQLKFSKPDPFSFDDIMTLVEPVNKGKKKCDILKSIRGKIGDKLGISVNTKECTHGDNCPGTCPACDAEAAKLSAKLLEGNTDGFDSIDAVPWGGENYVDGEMIDFRGSGFENLEAPDGIGPDIEDPLAGEAMPFPDEDDPLMGEDMPLTDEGQDN